MTTTGAGGTSSRIGRAVGKIASVATRSIREGR